MMPITHVDSCIGPEGPDVLEHLPPIKTGVCLLYCFVLSPLILLGAVPHHHLALSVKELTYSSNS